MTLNRFTQHAMLIMAGMGVGLVTSYYGGLLLWGGLMCVLVVVVLVREWGNGNPVDSN